MNATPPVELVLTRIRTHSYDGKGAMLKATPRGWESRCPAHDDRMPSLGIGKGDRGDALLKCAAGCSVQDVAAALGLTMKELFMPNGHTAPKNGTPHQTKQRKTHPIILDAIHAAKFGCAQRLELPTESLTLAGHWPYANAEGRIIAAVVRFNLPLKPGEAKPAKQFSPLHAVPGGWQVGDPKVWPLFHLPDVNHAVKKIGRIWWHEGEKAAEAWQSTLGHISSTTAHGAKSPGMTDFTPLVGVDEVIILPDNDDAGRKYAEEIARRVMAIAPLAKVRILCLPGLPPKGDAVEWLELQAGEPVEATLAAVDELVEACPVLTSPPAATPPPPNPPPAAELAPTLTIDEPQIPMPGSTPLQAAAAGKPWILRDLGNAHRFVHMHQAKARYDCRRGIWRLWDGKHWASDENQTGIYELATATVHSLFEEAKVCRNAHAEDIAKWAAKSHDRTRIEAMLALAMRQTPLVPPASAWDRDPFAFTCANGTIDLKTATKAPHNPAQLITCYSPATFDLEAHSDLFLRSLAQWQTEIPTIEFLQQAAGYSLTGDTGEEKLFLIHGPPAAGKSTFIEMMKAVLGTYSKTADFSSFLKQANSNGGSARGDIARLAGARFVSSTESEEGKEIAEGLVKGMTGGDTITARYLFRDEFEFKPQFKLWLVTNHAPHIDADDTAMWRRVVRVPFEHTIPVERRDKTVKARLIDVQETGAAFLAWAVLGCAEWLAKGLRIPPALEAATEELREEMDSTIEFFEEHLEFDKRYSCSWVEIIQAYDSWCIQRCIPPNRRLGQKKLAMKVKAKGGKPERTEAGRFWVNVHRKLI